MRRAQRDRGIANETGVAHAIQIQLGIIPDFDGFSLNQPDRAGDSIDW